MAKVWKAKRGPEPTHGECWAIVSIEDCQANLRLKESGFLKGPPRPEELRAGPRFGNVDDAIARCRAAEFVVIELEHDEANAQGWKAGYYLAEISVAEAVRFIEH